MTKMRPLHTYPDLKTPVINPPCGTVVCKQRARLQALRSNKARPVGLYCQLCVCVCVFITRACKLKKNPPRARASVARNSLCQSCSLESPYGPNLWSSLSCVTCVRCHRVCSGPSPFPFPFPCSCGRTCVRVVVAPATAAALAARAAAAAGSRRGRGSCPRARSG